MIDGQSAVHRVMLNSGIPESLYNALAHAREDKELVSNQQAKKKPSLSAGLRVLLHAFHFNLEGDNRLIKRFHISRWIVATRLGSFAALFHAVECSFDELSE